MKDFHEDYHDLDGNIWKDVAAGVMHDLQKMIQAGQIRCFDRNGKPTSVEKSVFVNCTTINAALAYENYGEVFGRKPVRLKSSPFVN